MGILEGMNLPAGPLRATGHDPIKIIGSLLRGWVRTNMTRHETVFDGQQIHTDLSQLTLEWYAAQSVSSIA